MHSVDLAGLNLQKDVTSCVELPFLLDLGSIPRQGKTHESSGKYSCVTKERSTELNIGL